MHAQLMKTVGAKKIVLGKLKKKGLMGGGGWVGIHPLPCPRVKIKQLLVSLVHNTHFFMSSCNSISFQSLTKVDRLHFSNSMYWNLFLL